MLIRKATLKDIPETCRMGYELNKYHEKLDEYFVQSKDALKVFRKLHTNSLRSSNSIFLVAEKNEKLIGYAIAKIDKRPAVYKVQRIGFVKKSYRKMGVSKIFMNKFKSFLHTQRTKI